MGEPERSELKNVVQQKKTRKLSLRHSFSDPGVFHVFYQNVFHSLIKPVSKVSKSNDSVLIR